MFSELVEMPMKPFHKLMMLGVIKRLVMQRKQFIHQRVVLLN